MIGSTSLGAYNFFNIREENNNFDFRRSPEAFGAVSNLPDVSFKDFKDVAAKTFGVSDISINGIQDETIGPKNF